MEATKITTEKGYEFQAIKFDWNKDGFYSVENITRLLVLENVISSGEAFKIEIMNKIEDQISALIPFQKSFEPILRYGYR